MELDGYDDAQIITPDMVTNVCFRYYLTWTWFVITLIRTLMDELNLWTLCMWHICWIMYDLGCMLMVNRDPSWYSMDYRIYMDSSMTAWPLTGRHCTCALINWTVLLQLASEQGSTLNLSYGYLKQRFCFYKISLTTYSYIYRCVKNLNFKFRVCQWSYPLCIVKDYQVAK